MKERTFAKDREKVMKFRTFFIHALNFFKERLPGIETQLKNLIRILHG
jgi:hypothetical protein